MDYHISKFVNSKFEETIEKINQNLPKYGFGIITEIDVKATMKKKLDIDFRNYKILGACNPKFAHKAITIENKIGVMLPCNIVVQEHIDGKVEVSAINPYISMQSVKNEQLNDIANEVIVTLNKIISEL